MARRFPWLARWLVLLLAPLLLTSCLLVPAKFVSTLDIRADRSFTFTYVGEVQLMKSSKPDASDESSSDGESTDQSWREEDGEPQLIRIAAEAPSRQSSKQKPKAKEPSAKADDNFGDAPDEATQLRRLAQTLAGEYGFRSARYIGNRKLAIDYRITGTLDHAFVFPFNPDGEIIVPFLAIELRGKDRLRVKAPGFANEKSSGSDMGGMGSLASNDTPSELDGTFTLTTDAEIVSQNQEEGAQAIAGGKKIVWTVNPDTHDAPMAVLRVKAPALMRRALASLAALLLTAAPALAQDKPASYGVWTNPQRSVQVRAHPCGPAMCGVVVWANDKAKADARRGGTSELIGAELFKGFVKESEAVWRGKVFVPDIGKTFSGTITLVDPHTLRANGCLLGRIGCKSQVWTRVDRPS